MLNRSYFSNGFVIVLQEIKNVQLDEPISERADDEMDVSDEDEPPLKKKHRDSEEKNNLKEENDSLRCQMEAYKNEVISVLIKIEKTI